MVQRALLETRELAALKDLWVLRVLKVLKAFQAFKETRATKVILVQLASQVFGVQLVTVGRAVRLAILAWRVPRETRAFQDEVARKVQLDDLEHQATKVQSVLKAR